MQRFHALPRGLIAGPVPRITEPRKQQIHTAGKSVVSSTEPPGASPAPVASTGTRGVIAVQAPTWSVGMTGRDRCRRARTGRATGSTAGADRTLRPSLNPGRQNARVPSGTPSRGAGSPRTVCRLWPRAACCADRVRCPGSDRAEGKRGDHGSLPAMSGGVSPSLDRPLPAFDEGLRAHARLSSQAWASFRRVHSCGAPGTPGKR